MYFFNAIICYDLIFFVLCIYRILSRILKLIGELRHVIMPKTLRSLNIDKNTKLYFLNIIMFQIKVVDIALVIRKY